MERQNTIVALYVQGGPSCIHGVAKDGDHLVVRWCIAVRSRTGDTEVAGSIPTRTAVD